MADEDNNFAAEPSGDLNPYTPLHIGPSVSHYYGDYVRQIFMGCGALMLVLAPFLASTMPFLLPFEIGGAIIIAILGAMTNPRNQLSMLANAIAAGAGVVIYEILALSLYADGHMLAFFVREFVAIAFLFALYFSLKTFRNMLLHMIGKPSASHPHTHTRQTPQAPRRNSGDGD